MTALVAGIDSSTQSCKVVIREASRGALVREGRPRTRPAGSTRGLVAGADVGLAGAGGLDGWPPVRGYQQHGMVCPTSRAAWSGPRCGMNQTAAARGTGGRAR
jgi:xylulokinase